MTAKEKWVRLECDYYSSGLWDNTGCNVRFRGVPVSADTAFELGAWQAAFDLLDEGERGEFDRARHSDHGLYIARLVKEDLPEWTVMFNGQEVKL